MKKYDIAAYVWPAYTGKEIRSRIFWPDGIGEWQTVRDTNIERPGYIWNRKPLWGYCDEADSAVMEFQIEEATRHGVNVFIYDWYWYENRPYLENCLNDGFLKAKNRDKMKFFLMWANHDVNYTWDKRLSDTVWTEPCTLWNGAVDEKEFEKITDRVIEKYFSEPNYYRIDGKPVFMIYDARNLINGLGGMEATLKALTRFREKTVAAGHPGLELQLTVWGERISNVSGVDGEKRLSTKEIAHTLNFDSTTNYQFAHFSDMNRDYGLILEDAYREWDRMTKEYSIPFYPHVSIGWDNNPRFKTFVQRVCTGNTPERFAEALRRAREYVDTHSDTLRAPLITVNSWNEWTETSYLQPDNVYGYGYLEAVKQVFVDEPEDHAN